MYISSQWEVKMTGNSEIGGKQQIEYVVYELIIKNRRYLTNKP